MPTVTLSQPFDMLGLLNADFSDATATFPNPATARVTFDDGHEVLTVNLSPTQVTGFTLAEDGVPEVTGSGFTLARGTAQADLSADPPHVRTFLTHLFATNDTMAGSNNADLLMGFDGNDSLQGKLGFDTLQGNNGNDRIGGGNQGDSVRGGAGNDSINGGRGNDQLSGESGNDTVSGGPGKDHVSGGGGSGPDGNDFLTGNELNDTILGFAGNDTINGGPGDDYMNGSLGADRYDFAVWGHDVIGTWDDFEDKIITHGLDPTDISITGTGGNDAVITLLATGDTITIGGAKGLIDNDDIVWAP